MRLTKLFIPVPAAAPAPLDASPVSIHPDRELLALLTTPEPPAPASQPASHPAETATAFDEVLVYLHGFPDMAVHPARAGFASRLPQKLAEFWLQAQRNVAFVTFNFGGVPGSDAGPMRFQDKTVGREVQDAAAVCRFVRARLLLAARTDGHRPGRLHVVGLSTGAVVAALLRSERALCDSITAIAGLVDVAQGVRLDFSPRQLAQVQVLGYCWKEFYLPDGCALPRLAAVSLDGETRASQAELEALEAAGSAPPKLFLRLDRRYVAECLDGSLDVRAAVDGSVGSAPLPPLLVVHGDADRNVPIACGEALFAAAATPKTFVAIPKANHLLSSSRHLKLALRAIRAHVDAAPTPRQGAW